MSNSSPQGSAPLQPSSKSQGLTQSILTAAPARSALALALASATTSTSIPPASPPAALQPTSAALQPASAALQPASAAVHSASAAVKPASASAAVQPVSSPPRPQCSALPISKGSAPPSHLATMWSRSRRPASSTQAPLSPASHTHVPSSLASQTQVPWSPASQTQAPLPLVSKTRSSVVVSLPDLLVPRRRPPPLQHPTSSLPPCLLLRFPPRLCLSSCVLICLITFSCVLLVF